MKIIGLDIGTTTICGICFDTDSGDIVKSITLPNDTFLQTNNKWQKQQDANKIIDIVIKIYDELLTICPDAVSVGITGQMHGVVYLDENGKPVSPLTIWQDGRGDLPYKDNKTYAEYLSDITGYKMATGYGGTTHFYNTVNGLIPENAVTMCTIHDLAALALTGSNKPLIHSSDAASFGLFDFKNNSFDEAAIKETGMDMSYFPTVAEEYQVLGNTKKGIPVTIAIGDNQASVLGSVADLDNSLLINVGTGSQVSVITDKPVCGVGIECRPLIEDKYLLVGSSLCGGRAYAVLEKFLRETASIISGLEIKSAYPIMDKLMENYDYSNNTLTVDTAFSGTREEPEKRGNISGISTENLTVSNLCVAFMKGIVSELFDMYKSMLPLISKKPSCIVGSGNGLRCNTALLKLFESEFCNKIKIPLQQEEAAFGAAIYSMTGAGYAKNIKEAQRLIKY